MLSTSSLFIPYDVDEIRCVIIASSSKSCQLDPVPSNMVNEFNTELLPLIARMCSSSLETGYLPQSQRHAVITLILKKMNANVSVVSDYHLGG